MFWRAEAIVGPSKPQITRGATGRLRRLVVLGHTGSITLEAIRWLADVGVGYLQVDADGRVLVAFGPLGTDRPALRRAQARALDAPLGTVIARRLIAEKVARQAATLADLADHVLVDEVKVATIHDVATRIHVATNRDELRFAEAMGAGAYWQAWSAVELRWAKRDADRVPAHWRTFGTRSSPVTGNPRLAANPANALLNYLHALLEGEATLAARVVGLDPGLGVLHADQLNRDSLAADLMEPVRPVVDRYLLDLLTSRSLAADLFHETRQGVCRLTPPIARELSSTLATWRIEVGRIAEAVAARLVGDDPGPRPVPTPVTGRNRAAGRPSGPRSRGKRSLGPRACSWCGGPKPTERRACGEACEAAARAAQDHEPFVQGAHARLRELRAAGIEPLTPEARSRMARRQSARRREETEWNAAHAERADLEVFRRDVLPANRDVPLLELARRTGLSVTYCGLVRRGVEVPHERWWGLLTRGSAAGRPRVRLPRHGQSQGLDEPENVGLDDRGLTRLAAALARWKEHASRRHRQGVPYAAFTTAREPRCFRLAPACSPSLNGPLAGRTRAERIKPDQGSRNEGAPTDGQTVHSGLRQRLR